ncbi:MAG: pyridoxamine 5'-phosphate oxidase family protein [Proteobacteria bacterium]|nr:pyridoxamine 5'-phosphate oxidase family protein [Pseudomonadota bacterium]
MSTTQTQRDDHAATWKSIEDARIGFVATFGKDAAPRARPLTTQKADQGTLWFFIDRHGELADEIAADPRVLLTYADTSASFYASMTGRGHVSVDPQKARELWSKIAEAWFPGGPEDPKLGLLRIDVEHGETWEPTTNKVVQFMSIAAAAITHTPPKHEGKHTEFTA